MQKSTGKYYDHTELTALWNRVNKLRNHGGGSGSGTLSDIIIDDDNEKQSRFLYDVAIDPEDDSRLIFSRNPLDIPGLSNPSTDTKQETESVFIYNVTIDSTDDHKLILHTAPIPAGFELQPATTTTLGGIKVGQHLNIASDGLLDVIWPDLSNYFNNVTTSGSGNIVQSVTIDPSDHNNIIVTYRSSIGLSELVPGSGAGGFLKYNSTTSSWYWDTASYLDAGDIENLIIQGKKNGTNISGTTKTYDPLTGATIPIESLTIGVTYGSVTSATNSSTDYNPLGSYVSKTITIPKNISHLVDDVIYGHYLPIEGGTLTGPLVIAGSSNPSRPADLTIQGILNVPAHAPGETGTHAADTASFWLADGEYAEDPGSGGGGGGALLTIKRNGATVASYNGSQDKEANILVADTLDQLLGVSSGTGLLYRGGSNNWTFKSIDATGGIASVTYVDNKVAGATVYKGTYDAATGKVNGTNDTFTSLDIKQGFMYKVSAAGTLLGADLDIGDSIIFINDVPAGTAPTAADVSFVEADVPITPGTSTLAWNTEVTLVTVDGVAVKAKLPSNPDTHNSHSVDFTAVSGTPQTLSHGGNFTVVTAISDSTTSATTMESDYTTVKFTLPTETQLSKVDTETGNTITGLDTSNHQITIHRGNMVTASEHASNLHKIFTLRVEKDTNPTTYTTVGNTYDSLAAQTYTISRQAILDAIGDSMYVRKTGDTMSGALTIYNDITVTGTSTFSGTLNVPAHAPGSGSGTASFWLADGEYATDIGGGGGGGGALLTIKQNNVTVASYNGSTDVEANITVPTALSQLSGTSELIKIQNIATAASHGFLTRNSDNTWSWNTNTYNNIYQAIPYIVGPDTDTTAGTWTGTYAGITELTDGLTIIYVPHVAGASTTRLNINGLGGHICYYTDTAKITTQYAVGVPILLTYRTVDGVGRWCRADYNSNTTYSAGTKALFDEGTNTSNRVWSAKVLAETVAPIVHTHVWADITDAPTIPTVYDAEFSIYAKVNGTSTEVSDFTANQSTDDSITFEQGDNITFDITTSKTLKISAVVPTIPTHRTLTLRTKKVSDGSIISTLSPVYNPVGSSDQTIDIPVPDKLSQLTNDGNYITTNNIKTSGTGNYLTGVTVNSTTNDVTFSYGSTSGLLTSFTGGGITSSGNTLTQANHSITVGGTTLTAGSSTASIINTLTSSASSAEAASSTNNFSSTVTVNGVNTTFSIKNLYASYAAQVKTQTASSNTEYYLTFVDSNNSSAAYESVYTEGNIKYNPSTGALTINKILNIPAHAPGATGTGSTDTASFWLADGEYAADTGGGGGGGGALLTIKQNGTTVASYNGSTDTIANIETSWANLTNKPTASSSVLGLIKVGSGLSIDNSGVLSATYSLPVATTDVRGGVKVYNVVSSAVAAATGSTASRYYGVQRGSDEKLFVNVPWENTHNAHKIDFTASSGTPQTLTSGGTFTAVTAIADSASASTSDITSTYTTVQFTLPEFPEVTESITYANLKTKRDGGTLTPGQWYRITDYVTTTTKAFSRAMGHQFDILVLATDASHLSEVAGACLHAGDTYFANTNFRKWRIWYCLDNDTGRCDWVDTTNGKGVIYRMIDEWDNDIPYDFKNIQFKRYKVTAKNTNPELAVLNNLYLGNETDTTGLDKTTSDYKWFYTFSQLGSAWTTDATDASLSIVSNEVATRNVWGPKPTGNEVTQQLNNIVCMNGPLVETFLKAHGAASLYEGSVSIDFVSGVKTNDLTFFGPNGNVRANSCFRHNIIVGEHRHADYKTDCQYNTIVCFDDNAFNNFNDAFSRNIIVTTGKIYGNNFGINFYQNTINVNDSTGIIYNKFNEFHDNVINCSGYISGNDFGTRFYNNTIYCELVANTFGSSVYDNTFGTSGDTSSVYIQCNVFGNTIRNNVFKSNFNFNRLSGQLNNCSFGTYVVQCVFDPLMAYVDIADGTSSTMFSNVHVRGNIRGTSSAHLTLESSEFRQSSVSGARRHVEIEGDKDGKVIATWFDGQYETGIYKATSASTWTPLPALAHADHTHTIVSGLKSDGTTNITSTTTNNIITLGEVLAAAGSYGDSTNQTPGYGQTFKVPYVTVNKQGIITAISEHTVKIPASDNTNTAQLQVSDTTNKRINTVESTGKYIQFSSGTNKFTVTDAANASFDVDVTPSITNNVTYSGTPTAGQLTVWDSAGVIKNSGYTVGSSGTLFSAHTGGTISVNTTSSPNTISQSQQTITIGGKTINVSATSVNIINTLTSSASSAEAASSTNNFSSTVTINGVDTTFSIKNLYASYAAQVKTQSSSTNAEHYLTFVDSNNSGGSYETVYTEGNIKYNPSTGALTINKILNVPAHAPGATGTGSTDTASFWLADGEYASDEGSGGGGGGGALLTIKRNGATVASYNGSQDKEANILVADTLDQLLNVSSGTGLLYRGGSNSWTFKSIAPSGGTGDIASTAYVDNKLSGATIYKGDFAATGDGAITGGGTIKSVANKIGDMYVVTTAGTTAWPDSSGKILDVGDSIIFKANVAAGTLPTSSQVTFVQGTVRVSSENATLNFGTNNIKIATVEGVEIKVNMPAQYSLPVATASVLGGVKVYNVVSSAITAAAGSTTDRYYGVQIGSDNKIFVNVPWENTHNSHGHTFSTTVPSSATSLSFGGEFNVVTELGNASATTGNLSSTYTTVKYKLPAETTLSKGTTTGTGNAVTDISVSGHTITLSKGSTFSLSNHTHWNLTTEGDNRSVATKPNDYVNTFAFKGLKNNSTIGISETGTGTYSYLIGLRGWSDSSGGDAHELAFNNGGIYHRQGTTTTFGNWSKIAYTSDLGAYVKIAGDTMTGSLTMSGSSTNIRINSGTEYFGTASGSQCHVQYDDTNKCLDFIFD